MSPTMEAVITPINISGLLGDIVVDLEDGGGVDGEGLDDGCVQIIAWGILPVGYIWGVNGVGTIDVGCHMDCVTGVVVIVDCKVGDGGTLVLKLITLEVVNPVA